MSFLLDAVNRVMVSTIIAQPVHRDQYGDYVASGEALNIPCHLVGRNKLVTADDGTEHVSTVHANLDGVYGLTVDGYVYQLPARYGVGQRRAISIGRYDDHDGPHHEVVYL